MFDKTLAFEDTNSDIIIYNDNVADVDAKEDVYSTVVEILKLKFGKDVKAEI